jgi:hypothetical protein
VAITAAPRKERAPKPRKDRAPKPKKVADPQEVPTSQPAPPPEPEGTAPLTGEYGYFGGRLGRPAVMVKVDNVPMARPQAGLRDADIVIEEPVEGNYTRLAAVFHSRDAVVGPIRSTRTTDFDLFPLFGRILFASAGGNPSVMGQLRQTDVVEIGHTSPTGHVMTRLPDRPMPHNLFAPTSDLVHFAPEKPAPPRPVFSYLADGEPLAAGATPTNGVVLWFGGHEIARFHWDAPSGTWPRLQEGTPHLDADGVLIAPRNVVVLEIDHDMTGQYGRSVPHGVSVGTGRATVLTQGHAIVGTWERPSPLHPLRLVSDAGQEIALTPGQTFIELPPRGSVALL